MDPAEGLFAFLIVCVIAGTISGLVGKLLKHRERVQEGRGNTDALERRLARLEERLANLETIVVNAEKKRHFDDATAGRAPARQ